MPATQIPSPQIAPQAIQRTDLCVSGLTGTNVIAKVIQGTGLTITATGNDAGTGDATIALAAIPSQSILGNQSLGASAPSAQTAWANPSWLTSLPWTKITGAPAFITQSNAEPPLGNPIADGYILSSTALGVRSWIAPPSGGGGGNVSNVGTPAVGTLAQWNTDSTHIGALSGTIGTGFISLASGSGVVTINGAAAQRTALGLAIGTNVEAWLNNPAANGYILSSNTSGVRSWIAPPSGGGIAGSNQQIQFNDSGVAAGAANLLWDKTNLLLRVVTNSGTDGMVSSPFGTTSIAQNCYYSGGWKYDKAGGAAMLQVTAGGTANIAMNVAVSGAAGGAITWLNVLSCNQGSGVAFGTAASPALGYINVPTGYMIGGANILPISTANGGTPTVGAAGQALYKNTAVSYDYSWKSPTHGQSSAFGTTAGTVSTVGVMAGFSVGFTPTTTGRVMIICAGTLKNSGSAMGTVCLGIRYGTGTAPIHGAALTGTTVVSPQCSFITAVAGGVAPYSCQGIVTALTVGTTYWADVGYGTNNASGTASLQTATLSVMEF